MDYLMWKTSLKEERSARILVNVIVWLEFELSFFELSPAMLATTLQGFLIFKRIIQQSANKNHSVIS